MPSSRHHHEQQNEAMPDGYDSMSDHSPQRTNQNDDWIRKDVHSLQLLYDVASAALESHSIDEAIHRTLARICRHENWQIAHAFAVHPLKQTELRLATYYYGNQTSRFARFRELTSELKLHSGEGLPGRVRATGRPEWLTSIGPETMSVRGELAAELGLQTALAFPVMLGGEPVIIVEVFSDQKLKQSNNTLVLMDRIGLQLGQLVERLSFEKQLADATEGKQQWIAQELHESVAQQLAGIGMLAEELRQKLISENTSLERRAARLVAYVHEAQKQVRSLSHGLMPVELDTHGLRVALNRLAAVSQEVSGTRCVFESSELVECEDLGTASYLYRIAQEAIQNAIEHSHADQIRLRLESTAQSVRLTVSDDGVGMDIDVQRAGMGIRTMRHLAGLIRARLKIESKADRGTTVTCIHTRHPD